VAVLFQGMMPKGSSPFPTPEQAGCGTAFSPSPAPRAAFSRNSAAFHALYCQVNENLV
jgi:hypothetical protein